MSWGTNYTFNGYLSRIAKKEIDSKREECVSINNTLWSELLAFAAATPPVYAKSEEGTEYPYAEFLTLTFEKIREEIENNVRLMARLDDCQEAMRENPESVTEG